MLRSAAAALTAAGLGGCDLGRQREDPPPAPDALAPFLAATNELAARYDAAIATVPSLSAHLTPLRDDHRAHVLALSREIGLTDAPSASTAPSAPAATDAAGTLAALAAAEKIAQQEAEKACLAAPSYRAALLGSIAACRASHREALA